MAEGQFHLTSEEVVALYVRAMERGDLERADALAGLLLAANDSEVASQ
jgi:hypothetical protein